MGRGGNRRRLRALLAAAIGILPVAARAGLAAQLNPGYSSGTTTARDETGAETRTDTTAWTQRYRLSLDERPYPQVGLSGGANLDWTLSDSRSSVAPPTSADAKTWNTFGTLSLGSSLLGGSLDYSRRWSENDVTTGGVTSSASGPTRESYGGAVAWRPADLPALTLRVGRTNAFDRLRQQVDQTSDDASLNAAYQPVANLDLHYAVRGSRFNDHLSGVQRSDVANSIIATWNDTYLERRGTYFLSYNLNTTTSNTTAPAGAAVPLQKTPIGGLSVVEAFPATPARVTLSPNAALVNGDLTASAGVNLGTAAGAGPVLANRDLGAQFVDVVTPVSLVHVSVDRTLPATLAALFTWEAYQSDNNLDWTPVGLGGAVQFNDVLQRFEVPIVRTSARYLKVVTRPLPASASTDPQYREIFVTELAFFDVVPAAQVRGRGSDLAGALTGTTRLLLNRDYGLAYDLSANFNHGSGRTSTWLVVNGLSAGRKLSPVFAAAARVARSDSESGRGHVAENTWSASLTADPIPTFGASANYGGQLSQTREGTATSHTASLAARADLYEGVGVGSTGSVGWAHSAVGVTTRSYLTSATLSLIPNRYLTLGSSVGYTYVVQTGGGVDRTDGRGQVEVNASAAPFPALALAGSVTRTFGSHVSPNTILTFSGGFSPFPGGDLQFRYGYTESYETSAQQRSRTHGPSARWMLRRGWYLDAAYTLQDSSSPISSQSSRFFAANLLIRLP